MEIIRFVVNVGKLNGDLVDVVYIGPPVVVGTCVVVGVSVVVGANVVEKIGTNLVVKLG